MADSSLIPVLGAHINRRQMLGASVLAVASVAFARVGTARADRFGEPSQYIVTAPVATVYQQPSTTAKSVGSLPKGSHVVGMSKSTASDGTSWMQIPEGYVPANQIQENYDEWVAEVTADAISIFAQPDQNSGVRRGAKKGDLLRVVGVSPGLSGDPYLYWGTTEGFIRLGTIKMPTSGWGPKWTLPTAAEAPHGWWGAINTDANIRAGATTHAPIVGGLGSGNMVKVLSQANGEYVQGSNVWYRIDGGRYAGAWVHSSLVQKVAPPPSNTAPVPNGNGRGLWLVVDKPASTLTVVQDGKPTFVTYTSLGVAGRQTPLGQYATNLKFVADRMTSRTVPDALNPYDLPAVPFTQYYTSSGAAVHGAYWHDDFGSPHSEGCINLTWADSWYVFNLTKPVVPPGKLTAQAYDGTATPLIIVG